LSGERKLHGKDRSRQNRVCLRKKKAKHAFSWGNKGKQLDEEEESFLCTTTGRLTGRRGGKKFGDIRKWTRQNESGVKKSQEPSKETIQDLGGEARQKFQKKKVKQRAKRPLGGCCDRSCQSGGENPRRQEGRRGRGSQAGGERRHALIRGKGVQTYTQEPPTARTSTEGKLCNPGGVLFKLIGERGRIRVFEIIH